MISKQRLNDFIKEPVSPYKTADVDLRRGNTLLSSERSDRL